ncbi:MAG: prolipoprotein diacylglyceryl transferase [Oscillospiraceae bacterium]|nr:prolipoprotein diacylglyceryl transferase [Oscillospiraceae bacterium]MBR6208339.1 prolipoprotein diacylglyceryl transferase [Oscillospiraceae bacterium]
MHNDLFTIFGRTVHGYGLMVGVGIVGHLLLSWRRARHRGLSEDYVTGVTIWTILCGFLGAKLLFLLTLLPEVIRDPLPYLGSEGFVVYGGLLAGLLTIWLWCRKKGLPFLPWLDLLLPGVALAQGFGRIGCFLAGCCYGRATDSPLGVIFPAGSLAPAGVRLLPTQLFSAAGDFLLCGALLLLDRRNPRDGALAAAYMLLYGAGRFLVEFLRDDPRGSVGLLSTSQFISLFIVAGGVLLGVLIRRKKA